MQPGTIISGTYRLDRELGAGGLGVVWLARDLALDRDVAIKFLHGSVRADTTRFQNEARALAALDHPGCVKLYQFARTEAGEPFLVMEYVEGTVLRELARPLPWPQAVALARSLAEVLAHAHGEGIVHRDLKPENVMLVGPAEKAAVKVLDFGLAKLTGREQPDVTRTGEVFGTPFYMSPEQLRGSRDVTPAADVYSLGVMLYELLEGELPFRGGTLLEIAYAHLRNPVPPLTREVPHELRQLVARLLAKDPAARVPNGQAALGALRSVSHERAREPMDGTRPGVPPWAIPALLVVAAIAAGFVATRGAREAPRVAPQPTTRDVTGLVASPDPAPDPVPAATTAPIDAGPTSVDASRVSGCGRDGQRGRRVLGVPTATFGVAEFDLIVPSAYDPQKKHPLLVLLPERSQTMLEDTRIAELTEREGAILLAPAVPFMRTHLWQDPGEVVQMADAIAEVRQAYCIDDDRILAIGHVSGGDVAERIPCILDDVDAIVTMSTRGKPGQAMCDRPIAHLHLAPLEDGYNPVAGGYSCHGTMKISLKEHEARWRERNGCQGKPRKREQKGGTCYEWTCDDAPLVSCHLDGGHNWPFAGKRRLDVANCDGTPANFEFHETIWAFFTDLE